MFFAFLKLNSHHNSFLWMEQIVSTFYIVFHQIHTQLSSTDQKGKVFGLSRLRDIY